MGIDRIAWLDVAPCAFLIGVLVSSPVLVLAPRTARAEDCDRDGRADAEAIAAGERPDCNDNGIPDACDLHPLPRLISPGFVRPPALVDEFVTGDFDGDGLADLVSRTGRSLWLQRALDAGGFSDATALDHGGQLPTALLAADFDDDGDLDIFQLGNASSFLWNDGRARFEIQAVALESSGPPVFATDVESDGDDDVLIVGSASKILRNHGTRRFEVESLTGTINDGRFAAIADFDRDGLIDVAIGGGGLRDRGEGVVVLRGTPEGFESSARIAVAFAGGLASGDFDADGLDDLLVGSDTAPGLVLARGRGDGTFDSPEAILDAAGARPVRVADLGNDGTLDVFVRTDSLSMLRRVRRRSDDRLDADIIFHGFGTSSDSIELADFDGDVRREFAAILRGQVVVIPVASDGSIGIRLDPGLSIEGRVFSGDVDGDLDDDLVALDRGSALVVLENRTAGGFAELYRIEPRPFAQFFEFTDFDADGDLDLVGGGGSIVVLLENDGNGEFPTRHVLRLGVSIRTLASADLDGDGDRDFVIGTDGALVIAEQVDGPYFGITQVFAGLREGAAVIDHDDDGDIDIVALDATGATVLDNDGSGRFAAASLDGVHGESIAVADLDDDGRADLLAFGRHELRIHDDIRELSSRPPRVVRDINLGPVRLIVDVDGDHDLDLIVGSGTYDLTILHNDNARGFFAHEGIRLTDDIRQFLWIDVDGDRDADLVALAVPQIHPTHPGRLIAFVNDQTLPTSRDDDIDGVPDDCGTAVRFRRGDIDDDGRIAVTDVIRVFDVMFRSGGTPPCWTAADTDDDGAVTLGDAILVLDYLFRSGPPPREPFASCGVDARADRLRCSRFDACSGRIEVGP